MISGYDEILRCLFETYYRDTGGHSDVTSSHWRTVGGHDVVKVGGDYLLDGKGFGAYRPNTAFHVISSLPESFLLKRLLRANGCHQDLEEAGREVTRRFGFNFSFDAAKQVLAFQRICDALDLRGRLSRCGIATVAVIGDGYGFMTNLLRKVDPALRVVCVNLGKTLFFDVNYTRLAAPTIVPVLLEADGDWERVDDAGLVFIEAEKYQLLDALPIDLFINIASMQEMDPPVVQAYFGYIRSGARSPVYFYCCNRVRKVLPDGSVTEFMSYPWRSDDEILVDELCPWYQRYPTSRPPFWRPFDGPVWHRFARMKGA